MTVPQIANRLTPEEEFYLEWGRETQKASISAAVDTLQRLISLNGTMLGGSLLLWQSSANVMWLRQTCSLLFLFSLLSAFWGILPSFAKVDLEEPHDIKKFKTSLLIKRNRCIQISALLTSIAFGIAIMTLVSATVSTHAEHQSRDQIPMNKMLDRSGGPTGS